MNPHDLTCLVCYDLVIDPVRLPCLRHVICLGCAEGIFELQGEVACPAGCKATPMPSSPFSVDAELVRYMNSAGGKLCEKCDVNQAELHCGVCDVTLCKTCDASHHAGKWKLHPVACYPPSGDVCERHANASVEVFCVEEMRGMCIMCLQEAEESGQRARCVPIVDVMNALMAEVRDMYSSLQDEKAWHRQAVLDMDHQAHKVREECLAEIHGVRHVFADIRSALDAKERCVIDALVVSKDKCLERIEKGRSERVTVVQGINQHMWAVQRGGLIMSAPGPLLQMRDTLSEVCAESLEVQKREPPRAVVARVKFSLGAFNVETLVSVET